MTKRQRDTGDKTLLHLHFASDPESVGGTLERIMVAVAALHLSDDDQSTTELVLAEVINNIVEHAYQERPDGQIELILTGSYLSIHCRLTDQGIAMPAGNIPNKKVHDLDCAIDDLPEGGFGWNIIRELTRDIKYHRLNGRNHLSFDLHFQATAVPH